MGSPVSVVVAEIVMQNIEEQALLTYTKTLALWPRYVDDIFTAVHKDEIDTFYEHLNRRNPHIQVTKEIEENGKIPFLDCLVSMRREQATDCHLQKTDTHRQISRPIILQPYFSQSHDHTNFD